LKAKPWKWSKT